MSEANYRLKLGRLILRAAGSSTVLLIFLHFGATPAFGTDHFNLESGIPTTLEDIEPVDRGASSCRDSGDFCDCGATRTLARRSLA